MQNPDIPAALRRATAPLASALWRGRPDPPAILPWPERLAGRRPFSLVPRRPAAIGAGLLLTFILFATTAQFMNDNMRNYSPASATFIAALLAFPAALRLTHPLGAWRWSLAMMVWAANQHWIGLPTYIPGGAIAFLLSVYSVAVRCDRGTTVGVAVLSTAGMWVVHRDSAVAGMVLVLLPLLVGHNVRVRRGNAQALAEQAEVHRERQAVLAERQRIAREMHDVVAHHMSVIAIQAEAAPYRVPDPDPVLAASFADIRGNALAALADLRRILGVLRTDDAAALTAPQPDLTRLDDLVANARGAGLTVTCTVSGTPATLPAAIGLAAYRIVQEALSNVLRHAPGATVRITVGYGDRLTLTVDNDPPADRPRDRAAGPGHGILGMRERATSLGGECTAGPRPDGGFTVTATLPLTEDR